MDFKRLDEIEARMSEIRDHLDNDNLSLSEMNAIEQEIKELQEERKRIEKRQRAAGKIQAGTVDYRVIPKPEGVGEKRTMNPETMKPGEILATEEYRSAFLKTMQGKDNLNEIEKRAFSSATNSAGAAVPTAIHEEVLKKLRQSQALFPHISVTQLPGNVSIPVEIGEAGATWVEELADIPESGNPIDSVKLGGFTLAKLVPVSIAAETMTAPAFEAYLVDIITEKLLIEIEKVTLNGTGTGQPTGILTGVTWTADSNNFTYATTGLTYDDMLKPLANLGSGYLPNAAWSMHSTTLYDQVAKITGADGETIFIPDSVEGFAGRIMGKPVVLNDYMPSGTILFGHFRHYFMNFSQPILFEKSRESGFRKATVDYRVVAVVDAKPAMDEAFIKLEKAAA